MKTDDEQKALRRWAPLMVMAVLAVGFLLYALMRTEKAPPVDSQVTEIQPVAAVERPSPPTQEMGPKLPEAKPPIPAGRPVVSQREETIRKFERFEADVLSDTHATRVRIETPQLAALTGRGPAQQTPASHGGAPGRPSGPGTDAGESGSAAPGKDAALSTAPDEAPGYVAFTISPEGMAEGVHLTMETIARHYFEQFAQSPQVTVSLVVGGGVRDRRTFFNNMDGTVRMGGGAQEAAGQR